MRPSELKYAHESRHPNSHFFDRETMQFFGDTMKNYGVRAIRVRDLDGAEVDVYELLRRNPVKCGVSHSAYFAVSDFRRVHCWAEDK